MSLNHFSGSYEDSLNPYYDKINSEYKDTNGVPVFKGIPATQPTNNSLSFILGGSVSFITPEVQYAVNDGKYVELYITEPFSRSFPSTQNQLVVILDDIHPDIRPQGVDLQVFDTVIGSLGADYGYSATSFYFNNEGSQLRIDFKQNSLLNVGDVGTVYDLSPNIRVIYQLNP